MNDALLLVAPTGASTALISTGSSLDGFAGWTVPLVDTSAAVHSIALLRGVREPALAWWGRRSAWVHRLAAAALDGVGYGLNWVSNSYTG
ncbi:MAG: hypothetical protein KDC38_10605 [Planctomycetes bacterium]|nr:hypothetical protein [Planctomycetota bacterium]